MTSYTEEGCPNKSDCDDPYHNHPMTQREKIEEKNDGLYKLLTDFRINLNRTSPVEAYETAITQIETLITESRMDELKTAAPHFVDKPTNFVYYNDRLATLQASLKGKEV